MILNLVKMRIEMAAKLWNNGIIVFSNDSILYTVNDCE